MTYDVSNKATKYIALVRLCQAMIYCRGMYLKTLDIQGFKSFAQKAVLTFLPPNNTAYSVTAIVGPNGSGKSNIADAIRWVMGEQSMKALRGKKSEDIIFSGSDAKGKMGLASVSMTLDNSDGRVDIPYEECTITRRLYRSGESEYLVNNQPARLLDVQLLLAKAQCGQGSYSIISQGTIDRLLLQTPAERKDFFDEAAGIKELQLKRHHAFLKYERTRENIAQASVVLAEVTPRLKTLSRQVKKLEERARVEEDLRSRQEQYYVTLWQETQDMIETIRLELQGVVGEHVQKQAELRRVQEELAELAKSSSRQVVFDRLQADYQGAVAKKNALERERALIQGKLQIEYAKVGQQQVAWLHERVTEIKAKVGVIETELRVAIDEAESSQKKLQEAREQMTVLASTREDLRKQIEKLETVVTERRHEEQMLLAIGLTAVQAVLNARRELGTVYGVVAELGKVDTRFQVALDVAAGAHLSSVVVEDDGVGEACIRYLRQAQLGIATFLPLNKIRGRVVPNDIGQYLHQPGVHGLAIELVKFDKKFAEVFSYILGNTIIVDDIATARSIGIGRVRMVTLTGDVLETSGSMKGGFRRARSQGLSFAHQGKEWTTATGAAPDVSAEKQRLIEQDNEYTRFESIMRQCEVVAAAAGTRVELLRQQKHALDEELSVISLELSRQTMSPEEYSQTLGDMAKRDVALDGEMSTMDSEIATLRDRMTSFHEEEEKKKVYIFALQDTMQTVQTSLNQLTEQKNQHHIALAKSETRQEDVVSEVAQEMRVALESFIKRGIPPVAPEECKALQAEIQKLKYQLSLIGGIDPEVMAEFEETKLRHETLTTQLTDLEKAMNDVEVLMAELDGMMKKKRARAFKEITEEFARYFSLLFEGGKADLVELYGEEKKDDETEDGGIVEAGAVIEEKKKRPQVLLGIDVVASPPGKKIQHLQSLSGGERTLTSIALICAILKVNPSPFVVLDEVEAALDEANTARFTRILRELASHSQFILITHNRATMHAADALYGVSMGGSGVSQLLSVKLDRGVSMVEN